jgi:N-acetyl-anhydromuramyl-L-alanine amidase AmpD
MVREAGSAWGNGIVTAGHDPWWGTRGNPNLETISIEHVKTGVRNQDALTPAQTVASFCLIAYLCAKYAIPRRRAAAVGGITGHASIDPVQRAFCPGTYPWEQLFG